MLNKLLEKLGFKSLHGHFGNSNLMTSGEAVWKMGGSESFATEGFMRNVIAYRCVSIISQALSSVPLKVKVNDKLQDKTHPLVQLLKKPNSLQGGSDFFEYYTAYRLIDGNAYLEKIETSITEGAKELWLWTPMEMEIKAKNGVRIPTSYKWTNGITTETWDVDPKTGNSAIMHWKSFHPKSQYYGLSPMAPGAFSIDQHNESSEWNMRSIQNGAVPTGILRNKGGALTTNQRKEIRQDINESHSGAVNARKTMILPGMLEYQQLSLSPIDMDFLNTHKNAAEEIAAAYGVPLQVIPISGSQTFANYGQARLALWEDTVIPLLIELIGRLNNEIAPGFGEGIEIFFDPNDIEALSEKRTQRLKDFNDIDYLTINQKLEANSYPPSENPLADELFQNASEFPLGSLDDLDMSEDEQEKIMAVILMDHKGITKDEALKEARAIIQSEK